MHDDDLVVQIICNNDNMFYLRAKLIIVDLAADNFLYLSENKPQNIEFGFKCSNCDTVKCLGSSSIWVVKWYSYID